MMWLWMPGKGLLPPCFRPASEPDRAWVFRREIGPYQHEMRITLRGNEVLETWLIDGQVLQDGPVQPHPKSRDLAFWFASRCSELTRQGWQLALQGAAPTDQPAPQGTDRPPAVPA